MVFLRFVPLVERMSSVIDPDFFHLHVQPLRHPHLSYPLNYVIF